MARLLFAVLVAGAVSVMAGYDMGPAAFMCPPDRAWNASLDNTAPCGSVDNVTSRTQFPLGEPCCTHLCLQFIILTRPANGVVAIVAQDDSYSVLMTVAFNNGTPNSHLSSYHNHSAAQLNSPDPKSQSDFTYVLDPVPINEVYPGHTCLSVPNPPSDITAGTNATIQLKYTAEFGHPENETFYACADITYVAASSFDSGSVPCFNATEPDTSASTTRTGTSPTTTSATASTAPQTSEAKKSGATLSQAGIAGAVVGAVMGACAIVGLGVLFYRERQSKKRLERQRDSARGVGWRADDPGKDSVSAGSFRLGAVSK